MMDFGPKFDQAYAMGRRCTVAEIQRATAAHFEITRSGLLAKCRKRHVVRPRQIAMFLAKGLTPRSYPELARLFGMEDHTTVLHAVRKIEWLVNRDAEVCADTLEIFTTLMDKPELLQ